MTSMDRTEMLHEPPGTLRAALAALELRGEAALHIDGELSPHLEIASHYRRHFATTPSSTRSGDEPVVLYRGSCSRLSVLMGLFGSRRRNEWLIGAPPARGARHLAAAMSEAVALTWVSDPPCQQVCSEPRLSSLPVLTTTEDDAGAFLTSGLVAAGDCARGFYSLSIHRMRVLDDDQLTIWMLPGRDLERLYLQALEQGESLPVSINVGAPPTAYLASSLSAPFVQPGGGELEAAGALQRSPIRIARCKTQDAFCLADSEIVLEGEIRSQVADEFSDPLKRHAMPEFLGYMGTAKPELPVITLSAICHRRDPIYQTFLGPGKEQSELLALPTEAGMLAHLAPAIRNGMQVLDAHYLAAGGGQLLLALQVRKRVDDPEGMVRLRDAVFSKHALTKAIWVVDEDIDLHSPEDLLWAASTRFQPSRDLHAVQNCPGFPLDPSQAAGYLDPVRPLTDRYLLDLTVPVAMRQRFARG